MLNYYFTACALTSCSSPNVIPAGLTEPAVGKCAARATKDTEINTRHVRGTFCMELTTRCRSLAAVR